MAVTQRVALINEQTIKSTSYVQLNVDGKMLSNAIIDTQFINLRPVLGDQLYQDLLAAVIAQNVTPIPEPLYKLLVDYIHPYLTHTVIEELLVAMSYRISNKGPIQYNDTQASSLTSDQLRDAKQWHGNKATSYKQVLIRYLTDEKLIDGVTTDKDTTSEGTGWFIAEEPGCGNYNSGLAPLPPDPDPAEPDVIGGSGIHVTVSPEEYTVNAGKDELTGEGVLTKPLNFERNTTTALTNIKQDDDIDLNASSNESVNKSNINLNPNLLTLSCEGAMYKAVTTSKPTGEHTIEILDDATDAVKSQIELTPDHVKLQVPTIVPGEGFTGSVKVETETITLSMEAVDTGAVKSITIGDSGVNDGIIIKDEVDSKGAVYDNDYSANNAANPRWIPDKNYVDEADTAIVSDLTIYADGVGAATLAAANTYADGIGSGTLTAANTYADGVGAATLANANAYADAAGAAAILSANGFTNAQIAALLTDAIFGGSPSPSVNPAPTVNTYYIVTAPGTYANMGGVVVNANSIAVISYTATTSTWFISQTALDLASYALKSYVDKHNPLVVLTRYEHPRGLTEQGGNGTWISPSILGWGVSAVVDQTGPVNKIEIPFFGFPTTEVEIRVYRQTSPTVLGSQMWAKIYAAGELNQNASVRTTLDVDLEFNAGEILGVVVGWKAGAQPNFRYWSVQSGVNPLRNKMIQANTNTYPGLFTGSWNFSSGSVWQAAIKAYYLPAAIQSVNTLIASTGLTELVTMQLEAIASDNFTTPGGFSSNPSFPITPTFTGGAMQLAFTAATNQSVIFNAANLVIGEKIEITIDVRRTAGTGGGLDIGNFGSATNTTEDKPYRSLLPADITGTFKTFKFKITPTSAVFNIGVNTSKNVGSTFEIDNIVVTKGSYKTSAAAEIAALKAATGVISSSVTTAELQTFINNNRYVRLGIGTFTLTAALNIPANTTIEGSGPATILKLGAGATWNCIDLTASSSNVTIKDVTFEGLAPIAPGTVTRANILAPPSSGNSGIYMVGFAPNVRIIGCNAYNFSWAGFHFYNTHTTSVYSRKVIVMNCFAEACYFGGLSRTRSEYISFIGNSFCNNKYGAYIAGGNNYWADNQFNANACGVVVSGTAGQNDSHGSLIGGSINHNVSFGIYVIDINAAFIFSGFNLFVSGIVLDNAKGAIIESSILGSSDITVLNNNGTYNLIRDVIFTTANVITGDLTKISMSGNRYLDGSDSTALNNNV